MHSACFGVAGPVRARAQQDFQPAMDHRCAGTGQATQTEFGRAAQRPRSVRLRNRWLWNRKISSPSAKARKTPKAIAQSSLPGPDLGMAGLYWDGFRHHPFACEGGHADFAPRNELQMELCIPPEKIWPRELRANSFRTGNQEHLRFPARHEKSGGAGLVAEQISAGSRSSGADFTAGAGGQGRDLRSDDVDFRQRLRRRNWKLRAELHVHRRNLHRRQHRRKERAQDEGSGFHGIFPGQGAHGGASERHAGEDRAQRRCGLIGAARYTLVQKAFSRDKRRSLNASVGFHGINRGSGDSGRAERGISGTRFGLTPYRPATPGRARA